MAVDDELGTSKPHWMEQDLSGHTRETHTHTHTCLWSGKLEHYELFFHAHATQHHHAATPHMYDMASTATGRYP